MICTGCEVWSWWVFLRSCWFLRWSLVIHRLCTDLGAYLWYMECIQKGGQIFVLYCIVLGCISLYKTSLQKNFELFFGFYDQKLHISQIVYWYIRFCFLAPIQKAVYKWIKNKKCNTKICILSLRFPSYIQKPDYRSSSLSLVILTRRF